MSLTRPSEMLLTTSDRRACSTWGLAAKKRKNRKTSTRINSRYAIGPRNSRFRLGIVSSCRSSPVHSGTTLPFVKPQESGHARVGGAVSEMRGQKRHRSSASPAAVHLGLQRADERQVAVTLGVVQPVPDHEHARDVEAGVLHLDVGLELLGLVEQGADLQGGRAPAAQVLEQVVEGQAGVDDVLDDEHVATLDLAVEVLEDADDARGLGGRAVGRHGHEVE